jgi:hypothetical protein
VLAELTDSSDEQALVALKKFLEYNRRIGMVSEEKRHENRKNLI